MSKDARGMSFQVIALLIVGMMLLFPCCSKEEEKDVIAEKETPTNVQDKEEGSAQPLVLIRRPNRGVSTLEGKAEKFIGRRGARKGIYRPSYCRARSPPRPARG